MQRICLLALLGLPAAGKTSFSRWLLALPSTQKQRRPFNVVHLCYDDHYRRQPTETDAADAAEEFSFKMQRLDILKLLESIVRSIRETKSLAALPTEIQNQTDVSLCANNEDFVIICDDNNYYRSMRYQLLQLCRAHCLAYAQIYFETDLQLALTRNEARAASEKVPSGTIEQMCRKLEIPDPQHQPWEAKTFVLETGCARESVIAFIGAAFENVEQPHVVCGESKSKESELTTAAHRLDLLLRRRIGELLKDVGGGTTGGAKQAKALVLNARRKEILCDFKETQVGTLNENVLRKYVDLLH